MAERVRKRGREREPGRGRERVILITGATSGLGRELARTLSTEPGRLILHGRDPAKLEGLRAELARGDDDPGASAAGADSGDDPGTPRSRATIDTVAADLSDMARVRGLADDVAGMTDHLSVLVNNAGVGKGSGDRRELSREGLELRLAVNHLAPFALSLRLLPLLRAGAPSRIVNVASGAQEPVDRDDLHLQHGYSGSRAYGQSKSAMITCGFVLADKVPAEVVTVNSLHPASLMPTRMVEEGYGFTIDDLATGVAATRRLVDSDDVAGVTGEYFSGTERSRAIPQTYEFEFRSWLWQVSEDLTGTSLR